VDFDFQAVDFIEMLWISIYSQMHFAKAGAILMTVVCNYAYRLFSRRSNDWSTDTSDPGHFGTSLSKV